MSDHHNREDGSLLQFPCDFPIKALGRHDGGFDSLVFTIVRKHAPDLGEAAMTTRVSRGGRYLAVTVTIRAVSRKQLDAIYHELSDHEAVMVAL